MKFRSTLGSATAVALLAGSALIAGSTPAQSLPPPRPAT